MPSVRVAQVGDREAVTAVVSAAFAHDPAWSFLLGDDYDGLAPLFAGALFDTRVSAGGVWVTSDLAAVAMWEPCGPDSPRPVDAEQIWKAYRAAVDPDTWQRLRAYERGVDSARPSTPYWYLGVLAARPDRHREGLATAVMAPVLERADGEGVDCCLETSTTSNKLFYEHRGFTQAAPVHIASGPPTWWLTRPPQGR